MEKKKKLRERRSYSRFKTKLGISGIFELDEHIGGYFDSFHPFLIMNVSLGGMKLLTVFEPEINSVSNLIIHYHGTHHHVEVKIVSVELQDMPFLDGMTESQNRVYAVGCQMQGPPELYRELMLSIIEFECSFNNSMFH